MSHIGLKYSKQIKLDSDSIKSFLNNKPSEKGKKIMDDYLKNNNYAEESDYDLVLTTKDSLIFGFDFLHNGKKLMMPEINPITIYFSNAIMSNVQIGKYKKILISDAKKGISQIHSFGNFFQLAFNCIMNLQSSIEVFVNLIIQENNYVFLKKDGTQRTGIINIHDKINIALPQILSKNFKINFENEYSQIEDLIKLRNDLIHLKPETEITNTKYKIPYRKVIEFNFDKTIIAVKKFINYYEPNLIEECNCGVNFYFDIIK
ncbi:MAG: hypothetical protein E2590_00570 [Chryseobacterium sp.]|nr:hypothetical protein [Chryseobacterium sp.]